MAQSTPIASTPSASPILDAEWARRQELEQLQSVARHNAAVLTAQSEARRASEAEAASMQADFQRAQADFAASQTTAAAAQDFAEAGFGEADFSSSAFASPSLPDRSFGTTDFTGPSAATRLNGQGGFDTTAADRAFGPAIDVRDGAAAFNAASASGFAASNRRDVWVEGEGYSERLQMTTRGVLRRADGSPLPPTLGDRAALDVDGYDVRSTRGFRPARGYTASGLEVSLTPHAGFGVGDRGGSAEAGATLRIGSDLNRMVKDGAEAFGQRARWYIYAAGSGRAVGYNFARTRDGDFTRSGYSHDSGNFFGDASVGVAYRRGDLQGSFGLVYREIEAEGLPRDDRIDRDVSEGLVAFQLSIKPER